MRIRIRHKTTYVYAEPAALGPQIIRLRPAEHTQAAVLSYNLDVEPKCEVKWQQDAWANRIARLTFPVEPLVERLSLTVDAAFDIKPVNPFDFYVDDDCKTVPFEYSKGSEGELAPFLAKPKMSPALAAFVEEVPAKGTTIDYLVALCAQVASTVGYIIRTEPGLQTSEQTLSRGKGSCRDSAVLLVDVLRARGMAARFVSGYLVQLADEGNIPDEAKGVASDVVDLHAWAEVFLPGAGWIGLDGTSGLFCGEGHIPLAGTVNPEMAAPVSGTSSGPATDFAFELEVVRLGHEPRPRKPYEEDTWADIVAAGETVDQSLLDAGIHLTSGGEPTWTSRLHPTEPEWITEALGATKLEQGLAMTRVLAKTFGTGTLAMQRMGKHYPGETLPRWVLHLVWREDGTPIWRDASLLAMGADEGQTKEPTTADAKAFATTLAKNLGVDATLIPGYEDPWHFIREEQDLPEDVDPLKADLNDSEQRRRLARVLGRGLGEPVGFALPIASAESGQWITSEWTFRREHMFLYPGESPMGLRMPLDRRSGKAPEAFPQDPSALITPIAFAPGTVPPSEPVAATEDPMRTALCVEAREGHLCVFVPPMDKSEEFLALVAAIEDTASELKTKVAVEGNAPPSDPRLRSCLVTPDPGVIEVNLPVCHSVREYTEYMDQLSDAALRSGLSTEKFQLDGREVSSGGGNHITMGGPTPLESPFLTKPHLLGGLLRYVQNHPALSYLFTGLFVGPTSQAPRADEARFDALAEIELALSQIPHGEEAPPPWHIDRLLRNLLTDVAGNTHRTEICIDKLYDPATSTGRQGIVELRAFEMPPHHHMATVQTLITRGLIARLAAEPYDAPMVRWGTQLHDRFMLPHYLWADVKDIVDDFARHGVPMKGEWLRPFLDHRCPVAGVQQFGDITLELRLGLEPWPVLGEQQAAASVARYVDASLERIQVRVNGVTEGRHIVTVNGVQVPLRSTGVASEQVGGVRFRAWQPPFCLQPQIGVHHPLRFDVIDTWGKRSLGACSYHVWHPGGTGYDEPPLTLFEAAARRAQRFTTEGHAPWPATVQPTEPHPEHPYTLDLRLHSAGVRHAIEL
jgi:uncharacterized protein (DUF2126 family)